MTAIEQTAPFDRRSMMGAVVLVFLALAVIGLGLGAYFFLLTPAETAASDRPPAPAAGAVEGADSR